MEKNFSFGEIRFALVADHTISVGCLMSCNSHNQYPGGILSPVTCHNRPPSSFPRPLDAKISSNQAPDGRIIPKIAVRVKLIRNTLILVSSCLFSLCLSVCLFACMRVKPNVPKHLS